MKKSKQCPKCDSLRVGHLESQWDWYDAHWFKERAPGHRVEPGLLCDKKIDVGAFEAYVCTECGYYESYVKAPKELDWQQLKGFHWVNPQHKTEGPYR